MRSEDKTPNAPADRTARYEVEAVVRQLWMFNYARSLRARK